MKFPMDQDVYASTIQLLRDLDQDVVTAAQLEMSRASDTKLPQAFVVVEPERHRMRRLPNLGNEGQYT